MNYWNSDNDGNHNKLILEFVREIGCLPSALTYVYFTKKTSTLQNSSNFILYYFIIF